MKDSEVKTVDILEGFEKWQPLPEKQLIDALKSGLVVFDANVLLHLYGLQQKSIDDWERFFGFLDGRVWLPHQVMDEFWKNRLAQIPQESDSKGWVGKISAAKTQLITVYEELLEASKVREQESIERVKKFEADLGTVVHKVEQAVVSSLEERRARFDSDPAHDDIVLLLNRHFAGRIGEPFIGEELEEQFAIAAERYAEEIPPGYHDDDNNPHSIKGKSSDAKYGDYLLWRQTLNHMKDAGSKYCNWLILVTNDSSPDWWRDPFPNLTDREKRNLGEWQVPHPSLVDEANREAGVKYIQLKSYQFVDLISTAYKLDPDEETRQSAKQAAMKESVSSKPARNIREEIESLVREGLDTHEYVISNYTDVVARAYIDEDGKQTEVLAESTAAKSYAQSAHSYLQNETQRLVEEGILVDRGVPGRYNFSENYTFTSPSTAAGVITGSNRNGKITWKTRTGMNAPLLKDVLDYLAEEDD